MTSIKISQKFFDNQSHTWDDDIDDEKIHKIKTIFRSKIPIIKGPVLDMGSGTGILLPIFENYNITKNIFELDISSKMLISTKEKYKQLEHVKYIQADGHFLPFVNNFFNTVVCFQVFPHFHNKIKVAEEIFSTLNMNGVLIILHLMGHQELNEFHRQAGREIEKDRILPPDKLAQLLSSIGFSIKMVEEHSELYLIIGQKY